MENAVAMSQELKSLFDKAGSTITLLESSGFVVDVEQKRLEVATPTGTHYITSYEVSVFKVEEI